MRKFMLKGLAVAGAAFMFASCAMVSSPVTGFIYGDVKAPLTATSNAGSSKVGMAEIKSIAGIISSGDASIEAAAKSAGITRIHHVDYRAMNIVTFYATYTVFVYGE